MFDWGIPLDLLIEGQAEGSPAGLGSFTAFLHLQLFNCDHPSRKPPPNVQLPAFQNIQVTNQLIIKVKTCVPIVQNETIPNIMKYHKTKTNLIWYTRSFYNVHVKKEKIVKKRVNSAKNYVWWPYLKPTHQAGSEVKALMRFLN